MSYKNGMAALNLEMTPQVPRTEYSAAEHWNLVKAVTGIDVAASSDDAVKQSARSAFVKAWDYGLEWNTSIYSSEFGETRSRMGHAVYADSGTDYDSQTYQLFDDPEDVFTFDFYEAFGKRDENTLVNRFNESYDSMVLKCPDTVNMAGIYISCMSGLIDLLGWDTLLAAAGLDDKLFGEFTNRYARWIEQYFIALAKCKSEVVMIHDDIVWISGAFLHPAWYRRFIFPNYKRLFAPLHEAGKKILFTSDGNYTEFIDDIADCGVNGFVMEPDTDMAYIAEKYGKTHSFVGNADTRILLTGTKDDIYNEVRR